MNYYDHIDDYKAGMLSNELSHAFEEALTKDENLRQLVENYDQIRSVSEGVLEMQLLNELSTIDSDQNLPNKPPRSANKYFLLTAVFLLLAAIAYFFFVKKDHIIEEQVLFAEVYSEPIWPTTRSSINDRSDTYYLGKAASMFLNDDLISAKMILLDSIENNSLGRYWLAEMYIARQELDSAQLHLPERNDLDAGKAKRIDLLNSWLQRFNSKN